MSLCSSLLLLIMDNDVIPSPLSALLTAYGADDFLLVGGVIIIVLSSIFILSSSLPDQSAFATFPGENGLIAFSARPDEQTVLGVYLTNSDGTGQERIDAEKGYGTLSNTPAWSPDRIKIAFTHYDASTVANINVMNYDGSNQIDLTQYPIDSYVYNVMGSWSPDGNKIAFQGGGNPDIHVMNADGTGRRQLTNTAGEQPAWSPEGDKIAFTRDGEIYIMNAADGGNQVKLTGEHLINEHVPDWGTQTTLPPSEKDASPPIIFVPEDIVVEATSEQVAQVTFTVTAQDNVDGTATLEEDGTTITHVNNPSASAPGRQ
jgi:Tol biopolymer transport system component